MTAPSVLAIKANHAQGLNGLIHLQQLYIDADLTSHFIHH